MRIEIRSDNSVVLDGYVNVPMRESRILPSPKGKFKELIKPKVFEKALMKAENVLLLFNHDKSKRLGSIKEGNLELREDNIGLRATCTVSCPDIIRKAKLGELRGWSFGMYVLNDSWEDGLDGIQKRYIEDIDLVEVSILDRTPAYISTSIETRGEEECLNEFRNEDFTATIEDRTENREENKDEHHEESKHIGSFYFANLENEISILNMKGC